TKDFFDNATPSGNSVAADLLLKLAAVLDHKDYREKAENIFLTATGFLKQHASGFGRMLAAFDFFVGPSQEIALIGPPESFLSVLRPRYLPRTVIAGGTDDRLALLRDRPMVNGQPTAYVCENFTCKQPVTDVTSFEKLL